MRIRSIKPEFWRSPELSNIDMELVYDGPMRRRINDVAPMRNDSEYVYFLRNAEDRIVYIGRSFRPADRFTKHRRKPWWRDVVSAAIVRVADTPPWARGSWAEGGPETRRVEAFAIAQLKPYGNVAPASKAAMS